MAAVDLSPVAPRRGSVSLSWVLTTSVPVILFVLFAIGHVQSWERTGHLTGALLVAQELVLVVLFVFRRRPIESSRHPLHWFVAIVGSFSSLLLRPSAQSSVLLDDVAFLLQVVGAGASIFCLISLGRSFGMVAANRGTKIGGPYRLVRHPIYASYLIGWAGYLLASPTLRNAVVLVVSVLFQNQRIASEERLLAKTRHIARIPRASRIG